MTNPPGLGAGTGGSNLTPGGEIRPGSPSQGGGTGGSTGSSTGGGDSLPAKPASLSLEDDLPLRWFHLRGFS